MDGRQFILLYDRGDWMALYLEQGDIDPAINNLELQAKLDMQLKEGRSRINKVVNDFVERQEREVACMEDDDFSIDLECEEECESIDDEEDQVCRIVLGAWQQKICAWQNE